MALYYDELELGRVYETPARTVTETDLVSFAMLTGDWNPIHTDKEYAKGTIYGRPVVHGMYCLVMMTGLLDRSGLFSGSAMAMLDIREWKFLKPVFVGDTLHATVEVVDKRLTSSGDRGIVDRRFSLVNQRGEVVQQGNLGLMIRREPQEMTV